MHVQCHLYMYMYTACLPIILCFGFENWYSVYWKEGTLFESLPPQSVVRLVVIYLVIKIFIVDSK